MIVVTGAAGFIGSALLGRLNQLGYGDLVAVDNFDNREKEKNLNGKSCLKIEREKFPEWLDTQGESVQMVFHIGARTDTSEKNEDVLSELNLTYSKEIWNACCKFSIPLIYASSAATYGDGTAGFSDELNLLDSYKPLNPYGWSKHLFDLWVRQQEQRPPFWAGFKFFNVFGPNEYHKGRMASVVFHSFNQIAQTGEVKLFRSHKEGFADGEQLRDFIYVKDLLDVLIYFMENRKNPGLYNLGTGVARSFYDLAAAVFMSLKKPVNIGFVDIPEDIRENYQYFTCADMKKLISAGYDKKFMSLEDAVSDYVNGYLITGEYY